MSYSCGMTEAEVDAEAAEAERETQQAVAERLAERKAALMVLTKDQRYYARKTARRMADSAAHRAGCAVPPWLTTGHEAAIIAMYQRAIDVGEATGVPHAVDHVVPLVGICRKTWKATGEREHVVCGLHVPWNLRPIPQGMNREIKRDWFDSDWPVDDGETKREWQEPPYLCEDDEIPF